jgi:hypothetical protein
MSNTDSSGGAQSKKLSLTAQWMLDHPNDVPCPLQPHGAAVWRKARGIGANAGPQPDKWRQYSEALADKRAREAAR